jgi:hypothetical protein
MKGVRRVLFNLPDILASKPDDATVFWVEGEKDATNAAKQLGLIATTCVEGAGSLKKWNPEYGEALRDRDVVLIPDADIAGKRHMLSIAANLQGVARRVRILYLPVHDISDWLSEHDKTEFQGLLSQARDWAPDMAAKYEDIPAGNLPQIVVNDRQLRDITTDALAALYAANKPEYIFRRSGSLARVNLDEDGRPCIERLDESTLRGCLARAGNFVRTRTQSAPLSVSPPLDVVRDCLAMSEWKLPALTGITEVPVVRPDGTVLTEPGYDSLTRLYYIPSPRLVVPPIPNNPNDEDISSASELMLEPLADFPFDSDASLANALATMLTPILRPMIDGPVPLALFDKPQQDTGASLLAEVISLIATGRAAAMMTAQKDDEGWRKAITSLLIKGQLVATIDNVEYDLWAPSLAAILTATTYQDRLLGRSEIVTLPNRTTWLATGNNIRLRGDLPRRCIWVRMDARMARPWLRDRSKFKHPQLPEWVSQNRGAILWAILTIARAWVGAGKPRGQEVPALGGYEAYCEVVGGVLTFIGVKGFLANLNAMYDEADTDTPQWEAFLEAWLEFIGIEPSTVAEIISKLNENMDFKASLPDSLAGKDGRDYSRRLGNALSRKSGVRYMNGLMIARAEKKKHSAIAWQVVKYEGSYEGSYEKDKTQTALALEGS